MFTVAKWEAYSMGYDPQQNCKPHLILQKEFEYYSTHLQMVMQDKSIQLKFAHQHHTHSYQHEDPDKPQEL